MSVKDRLKSVVGRSASSSADQDDTDNKSQASSSASASSSSPSGPRMTPVSPVPTSVDAQAAGSSSSSTSKDAPTRPRTRQGSLSDRGIAVLRAMQRAPADDSSHEDTPAGSNTPVLGEAELNGDGDALKSPASSDGYDPEGAAETSPTRRLHDEPVGGASADVSRSGSFVGLSEAEKQAGRANREGLRRRGEQREVEKMTVAAKSKRRKGSGDVNKKKSKSWEIPRKIFHSSIGFIVLWMYLSASDLAFVERLMSTFLCIVVTADIIRLNYHPFELFYESVLGFLMRESEKTKVNGVVWYLVGVIFVLHFLPTDIACVSVMMLSWADTAASTFGRLFGKYTPPLPSPPFATRKSLSGFLAAMVAGTITAYIFWGTAIASSADHPDGLSWNPHTAVLGATAPGPAQSGWSGWRWGFRGKLPIEYYTSQSSTADAVRNAAAHISTKLTGGTSVTETRAPGMPLPLLCLGSGIVGAVSEGLELGGVDDNLSLPILSGLGMWAWLFLWGRAATWWAQNVA